MSIRAGLDTAFFDVEGAERFHERVREVQDAQVALGPGQVFGLRVSAYREPPSAPGRAGVHSAGWLTVEIEFSRASASAVILWGRIHDVRGARGARLRGSYVEPFTVSYSCTFERGIGDRPMVETLDEVLGSLA